jgi:hypothetical protein
MNRHIDPDLIRLLGKVGQQTSRATTVAMNTTCPQHAKRRADFAHMSAKEKSTRRVRRVKTTHHGVVEKRH